MRRLLLIALTLFLGGSSLLALYIALDLDPDDTSPRVVVPSYASLFEASVRQRTGRAYSALDEARRAKVIGEIVGSREMAAVREVALYRARSLANRPAALAMLRRHLMTLPEDLFEVGAASIAALDLPAGRSYLDSLYAAVDRDPAAHTPLGGYRASTAVVSERAGGLAVALGERSRNGVDYALADATEITLLFPYGPDYVIGMPNADDVLDRFETSRFVRALDGSPVGGDAWTLPLLRTVHGLRRRLTENLGFLGSFFSPEQLVRDNLVLGRYGTAYLLASHKDKNVGVAEALISVFETFGGDFGIRRWKVGPTSAAAIVNRGTGSSLSYATVGDYLVVATDTALMTRALRTFHLDRARSVAIDPAFNAAYRSVDPSGVRDVLFAWFNPSKQFDVTGSEQPSAYRRAVLANVTGRTLVPLSGQPLAEQMRGMPGIVATVDASGDSASRIWRYIVAVRSLGRSPVDSLARLAGVDVGREIAPYLGSTWTIGYGGIEHLKREYGFSNTSFSIIAATPLVAPPATFDATFARFFGGITSLLFTTDSMPAQRARMWIARDTATSDTMLQARRLQPSYALVDNRLLLVATTPALLRRSVEYFAGAAAAPAPGPYASGFVRLDSFAGNASRYLRSYLLRSDRYSPEEIGRRIEPLRAAIAQYGTLDWIFTEARGLRRGEIRLGN